MPNSTVLDLPQQEQAAMLAARRGARYGDLLAPHLVLWCAAGRRPTDIAAVLFCSRSSVYRTVHASQTGTVDLKDDARGRLIPPIRPDGVGPHASARAPGAVEGAAAGVWLVSPPLALCHAGPDGADPTWDDGLR
jgi:hypothetical protein